MSNQSRGNSGMEQENMKRAVKSPMIQGGMDNSGADAQGRAREGFTGRGRSGRNVRTDSPKAPTE